MEEEKKIIREELKESREYREALLNILEDIEKARERAEEERDKTEMIIRSLTDGLLVFDKENNLSLINPQAQEMFRIKREEVEEKKIGELKKYPLLLPAIDLIFKGGKVKEVKRAAFSPQRGVTIEVTTIPLKREGRKTGFLAIFHDISREKIVEKLKSEFVSISAHQLRTPLSAIKWSLSLLKEEKMSEEERKDLIAKVYRSNERMIKLINDLLNVTRIEEGRYLYSPGLKDIIKILKESIQASREEAERKGIQFKLLLPKEEVPKIKVDEEKISLAISNIAGNAVQYTRPGGKVTISLKYDKGKNEVLFKFQDTGVGVPEHQKKRMFSKFFRGENVMRMETEGTGLGLFITKNVIEAHRGKIWFESEEGKGTTFYFTLPTSSKG